MKYQRINTIIKNSIPSEKGVMLSKARLERYENISHIVLAVMAGLGVVTLSIVAPNILMAIKPLLRVKRKKLLKEREDSTEVTNALTYLKRHGLIKLRPKGEDYEMIVTELGLQKLTGADFKMLKVNVPKKWNGLWWQVAADVPTKTHRLAADLFRRKLKKMGFYALQRSLWFYPYDPRVELQFLCEHYGLEYYVTVMEINRMDPEDEKVLSDYFKQRKII